MEVPSLPQPSQYRGFIAFACLAFALLYAEAGLAAHAFWPAHGVSVTVAAIIVAIATTVVGFGASYLLPPVLFPSPNAEKAIHVWPLLVRQSFAAMLIVIATNVIVFGLYAYLVNFDLVGLYNLLKDFFVYTMVGTVIYQGLMTYVRYAAFLYQTHEDSALKIIAVSGGIAALCLIVGLYLLTLDLVYLMTAPVAQQGRLGLHIYARDIWLIAMVVAGYAWHIRWLAEH